MTAKIRVKGNMWVYKKDLKKIYIHNEDFTQRVFYQTKNNNLIVRFSTFTFLEYRLLNKKDKKIFDSRYKFLKHNQL